MKWWMVGVVMAVVWLAALLLVANRLHHRMVAVAKSVGPAPLGVRRLPPKARPLWRRHDPRTVRHEMIHSPPDRDAMESYLLASQSLADLAAGQTIPVAARNDESKSAAQLLHQSMVCAAHDDLAEAVKLFTLIKDPTYSGIGIDRLAEIALLMGHSQTAYALVAKAQPTNGLSAQQAMLRADLRLLNAAYITGDESLVVDVIGQIEKLLPPAPPPATRPSTISATAPSPDPFLKDYEQHLIHLQIEHRDYTGALESSNLPNDVYNQDLLREQVDSEIRRHPGWRSAMLPATHPATGPATGPAPALPGQPIAQDQLPRIVSLLNYPDPGLKKNVVAAMNDGKLDEIERLAQAAPQLLQRCYVYLVLSMLRGRANDRDGARAAGRAAVENGAMAEHPGTASVAANVLVAEARRTGDLQWALHRQADAIRFIAASMRDPLAVLVSAVGEAAQAGDVQGTVNLIAAVPSESDRRALLLRVAQGLDGSVLEGRVGAVLSPIHMPVAPADDAPANTDASFAGKSMEQWVQILKAADCDTGGTPLKAPRASRSWPTPTHAITALVAIGKPAVPSLIELVKYTGTVRNPPRPRQWYLSLPGYALQKMGATIIPDVTELLRGDNEGALSDATIILHGFGQASIKPLSDLLTDPDTKVRERAQKILDGIAH